MAGLEDMLDIWGLAVASLRRWYVLVPLLIISLAAAFAIGSRSQSEYEVSGVVILLVPEQDPGSPNPYAGSSASQLLTIQATSSAARTAFLEKGLSDEYEVFHESRTPIVQLTVVAVSEQAALDTAEEIVEYLETTLDLSQKELGITKSARVTLGVVDAPDVVNPAEGGRLRLTGVLAVLGIIGSFACTVLVDAILARRKSLSGAGGTESPKPTAPGS